MFVVIGTRDLKNETPFIEIPLTTLPFLLLEKCREEIFNLIGISSLASKTQ